MTAHKAQGKTMDVVIMDLESTRGTEAPYVMLSRATSLEGVYILRPFKKNVIQRHPSQDVREEFRRMDMLYHQTIMQHGTAEEASQAQRYLVDNFSPQALPNPDNEMEVDTVDDARRLASLQKANSRLIAGALPQSDRRPASSHLPRPRITKGCTMRQHSTTGRKGSSALIEDELGSSRPKRQRISRV
ncbi:hypothetical protein B0H14DRAFT_3429680 [Mycena olivaceomarginata]|nr:hypothetical protein B0H14DRAFT_3429680 [Mycena olivaceomarginata]